MRQKRLMTPENTEIWMVNYKRWEECNTSCMMWLKSFPFRKINIIANHSEQGLERFDKSIRDKINIIYNNIRPNWLMGPLTQCWNTAYLNSFFDDSVEWVICTQDDVNVFSGWDTKINNDNEDRLVYFSPMGDVIHSIHRDGFYKVGWWDERFRIVKCQEQDFMLRCMRELGEEAMSVVDDHQWKLKINDIGLYKNWRKHFRTEEIINTNEPAELMFMTQYSYFMSKWGDVNEIFFNKNWSIDKKVEERDWYPSWTLEMKRKGSLPIDFEFPK